jgi:acyl-CoA reductase-like NAD-dependent aldehyde dehydrogenase
MSSDEVKAAVATARAAQQQWKNTTFEQRRRFLLTLNDYIVANQDDICRAACRDTGKTSMIAQLASTKSIVLVPLPI